MNDTPSVSYLAYIPAQVRYHDTLSANAKIFYAEITALSGKFGYCFASNAYFAEQFKMSDRTVSRLIRELEELHFITVKIVKCGQTGKVLGRRIYPDVVSDELIPEGDVITLNHLTKLSDPPDKIVQDQSPFLSTGFLIKNNNINNIYTGAGEEPAKEPKKPADGKPPKELKKPVDAVARAKLTAWAKEAFPDACEILTEALMSYCDVRYEKGKPMRTEKTADRCIKRLTTLSSGSLNAICEILDQSIRNEWIDTYPLKGEGCRDDKIPDCDSGEDGGPKWL